MNLEMQIENIILGIIEDRDELDYSDLQAVVTAETQKIINLIKG